ncbi:MAG: hypothetical protein ACQCN6_10055 [Candidatus Bathyarchaeia archaeon]|jgi:hypothetical protein
MTLAQPNTPKPKRAKATIAVLLVIALAATAFTVVVSYSVASPQEPDTVNPEPQLSGNEASGWQFIKTVLAIDTEKYNATVKSFDPPSPSFATEEQNANFPIDVQYHLNCSQSTLSIFCTFIQNKLAAAHLYLYTGTVLTRQPLSSNLTEAAINFLTAYQNFSGRNLTEMFQTLDGINLVNGSTVQLGDLKFNSTHRDLTGTAFGDSVDFRWLNIYSGCEYWALQLSFQDGHFGSFIDNRQWYQIGDTTVNISRQQAIDIALNAAESYSYKMSDDWWISDFNITYTDATLYPQSRGSVWYPCWTVNLYFDKTYPGSVHGIIVFVWAGSGEIEKIGNIAYTTPTDY